MCYLLVHFLDPVEDKSVNKDLFFKPTVNMVTL